MVENNIFIDTRFLMKILIGIIIILAFVNILLIFSFFFDLGSSVDLVMDLISLDNESNIPTFFSTILILLSSLILLGIAIVTKINRRHWFGLSAIFLFLAFDESFMIHERLTDFFRSYVAGIDFLVFAWVIPYFLLVLIFCIFYFRFFLRLPKKIKQLFALAFILYVGGALGLEILGAKLFVLYGRNSLPFFIEMIFEEILEMSGILVFVYALLTYVSQYLGGLNITIR